MPFLIDLIVLERVEKGRKSRPTLVIRNLLYRFNEVELGWSISTSRQHNSIVQRDLACLSTLLRAVLTSTKPGMCSAVTIFEAFLR